MAEYITPPEASNGTIEHLESLRGLLTELSDFSHQAWKGIHGPLVTDWEDSERLQRTDSVRRLTASGRKRAEAERQAILARQGDRIHFAATLFYAGKFDEAYALIGKSLELGKTLDQDPASLQAAATAAIYTEAEVKTGQRVLELILPVLESERAVNAIEALFEAGSWQYLNRALDHEARLTPWVIPQIVDELYRLEDTDAVSELVGMLHKLGPLSRAETHFQVSQRAAIATAAARLANIGHDLDATQREQLRREALAVLQCDRRASRMLARRLMYGSWDVDLSRELQKNRYIALCVLEQGAWHDNTAKLASAEKAQITDSLALDPLELFNIDLASAEFGADVAANRALRAFNEGAVAPNAANREAVIKALANSGQFKYATQLLQFWSEDTSNGAAVLHPSIGIKLATHIGFKMYEQNTNLSLHVDLATDQAFANRVRSLGLSDSDDIAAVIAVMNELYDPESIGLSPVPATSLSQLADSIVDQNARLLVKRAIELRSQIENFPTSPPAPH